MNNINPTTINFPCDLKIHDFAYNLYNTKQAVAGANGTIIIYDVTMDTLGQKVINEVERLDEAHLGPIWKIDFCHPVFGTFIATCSQDKTLKIWEVSDNKLQQIYTYDKHTSSVNSFQWAPHSMGFKLACCSSDGSISIISEDSWENQYMFKASNGAVNSVSWSPIKLSISERNLEKKNIMLISGGHDKAVKIWAINDSMRDSNLLINLEDLHTDMIRDVKFSPDVLENVYTFASCSEDCSIKITNIDVDNNQKVTTVMEKNIGFPVWRLGWNYTGRVVSGVYLGENKAGSSVSIVKKDTENWESLTEKLESL